MVSGCMTSESPSRMVFLIATLLFLAIHGCAEARTLEGGKISLRSDRRYCAGWMLNTATNNIVNWARPDFCIEYIADYMWGPQYMVDFGIAIDAADDYLQSLEPTNGKDAVMFDMDETTLSCLPYYSKHAYGGETHDFAAFDEWASKETAPALEPTLDLYKKLKARNWVVIFVSSRFEDDHRELLTKNLITVGFTDWDELVLRKRSQAELNASTYKAATRVDLEKTKGYTIRSCVGDQWSDCTGSATGDRIFKLPNPMYFVP